MDHQHLLGIRLQRVQALEATPRQQLASNEIVGGPKGETDGM